MQRFSELFLRISKNFSKEFMSLSNEKRLILSNLLKNVSTFVDENTQPKKDLERIVYNVNNSVCDILVLKDELGNALESFSWRKDTNAYLTEPWFIEKMQSIYNQLPQGYLNDLSEFVGVGFDENRDFVTIKMQFYGEDRFKWFLEIQMDAEKRKAYDVLTQMNNRTLNIDVYVHWCKKFGINLSKDFYEYNKIF